MSYILEALRKSERERNLGKVPTLSATTEVAAPRSRLRWWILLAATVVVAAMGWLWYAGGFPAPRVLVTGSTPQLPASGKPDGGATEGDSRPPLPPESSTAPAALPLDPAQITLNVISWSQDPARRFAMINQKIYREGDSPSPDVTITAIESDKVVVTAHGRELILHP